MVNYSVLKLTPLDVLWLVTETIRKTYNLQYFVFATLGPAAGVLGVHWQVEIGFRKVSFLHISSS